MKYYVTQDMQNPDAYPTLDDNEMSISRYVRPKTMADIGKVYGYVEYKNPLSDDLAKQYGLSKAVPKGKQKAIESSNSSLMDHPDIKKMFNVLAQYMPEEFQTIRNELQGMSTTIEQMQMKLEASIEQNQFLSMVNQQLSSTVAEISDNIIELSQQNQILSEHIKGIQDRTLSAKLGRVRDEISSYINNFSMDSVLEKATTVLMNAKQAIKENYENSMVGKSVNWVKTTVNEAIEQGLNGLRQMRDSVVSMTQRSKDFVINIAADVKDSVVKKTTDTRDAIVTKATALKQMVSDKIKSALKTAEDYYKFASFELTSLKNSVVSKARKISGELLETGTLVKNKIKDLFDIKRPMRTVAGWMAKSIMENDNLYYKMVRENLDIKKEDPEVLKYSFDTEGIDDNYEQIKTVTLGEDDYVIYNDVSKESRQQIDGLLPEEEVKQEMKEEFTVRKLPIDLKNDFLDVVLHENRKNATDIEEQAKKASILSDQVMQKYNEISVGIPASMNIEVKSEISTQSSQALDKLGAVEDIVQKAEIHTVKRRPGR